MLANKVISLKRLEKQTNAFENDPIDGVLVRRNQHLNFYFVIYGLGQPYLHGFYFGLLKLHENYPFAAPQLFFYTPNGRFEIDTAICASFTSHHQESWTSAWNVRSLLIAIVSFMNSEEATYGCRNDSASIRSILAKKSMQSNLKNKKFCDFFLAEIKSKNLFKGIEEIQGCISQNQRVEVGKIQNNEILLDNDEENTMGLLENANENKNRNNRNKIGRIISIIVIIILIILLVFFIY